MVRTITATDWPLARCFALPPRAVVLVAGCYEGATMKLLAEMYDCARLIGFDPQPWVCDRARELLADIPGVEIVPVGLDARNELREVYEWGTDAASVHRSTRGKDIGYFVDADRALRARDLDHIDLAVFNMEGAEYEVLPHLIATGWLRRIDRFAIQFHDGLGNEATEQSTLVALNTAYPYRIDNRPAWGYWAQYAPGPL